MKRCMIDVGSDADGKGDQQERHPRIYIQASDKSYLSPVALRHTF